MKSLETYILEAETNEMEKLVYSHEGNEIMIDCKYCSISVEVDNINYKTKSGKELLSGKEIVGIIDQSKDGSIDYNNILNLLKEKAQAIKDIHFEKENKYQYVLTLKDAKLWPPASAKLKEAKLELYQIFTLIITTKYGVNIPEFEIGDLVVEGIGKVKTKQLLVNYVKLAGTFYILLYNIGKDLCDAKDINSFKKISKIILNNIKKSIKNNLKSINELPDSYEMDKNVFVDKFNF